MKKITKILLIFLSLTLLFNCSDDNPETTSENQTMRLDSIVSTTNTVKFLFKYNNENVNIENEIFITDEDGVSKVKVLLSYNSDNLINTEIYKEWDGTNNMKIKYTYNSNLDITSKISSNWDLNDWVIYSIEYYNYNSGVLTEITKEYNGINNEKSNYIYENEILKKIEYYDWDDNNNDWYNNPSRKYEYLFDTNSNLTSKTEYLYFNYNGSWELGDNRYEYEYDNTYVIDYLILPVDIEIFNNVIFPISPNQMITKTKYFENESDNWVSNQDFEFYYSNINN